MSLVHESRDELKRRGWPSLRWCSVIVAAVAMVWSVTVIVGGWKASRNPIPETRLISAVGTVRRHVQPDRLLWQATISAHASDRATTLRKLSAQIKGLHDFLMAHDIKAEELSLYPAVCTEDTDTVTHHHPDGSEDVETKPKGFVATQKIELRTSDLARALRAVRESAATPELVLEIETTEPMCSYSAIDKLQDEMLGAAQTNVRVRADTAAAETGRAHLGKLVTTDQGSFSASMLGSSSLDVCERGADAIASVNAKYLLE